MTKDRVESIIDYVFPPIFYLGIALAGGAFTARGMDGWYQSLVKPAFTPPGGFIGAVWTAIYVMAALSFILFLRSTVSGGTMGLVVGLYIINGVINASWSWIFFDRHMLDLAVLDAGLIGITVAAIMVAVWPHSRWSCILLVPYLGWVTFATYLSYAIYRLNVRG